MRTCCLSITRKLNAINEENFNHNCINSYFNENVLYRQTHSREGLYNNFILPIVLMASMLKYSHQVKLVDHKLRSHCVALRHTRNKLCSSTHPSWVGRLFFPVQTLGQIAHSSLLTLAVCLTWCAIGSAALHGDNL